MYSSLPTCGRVVQFTNCSWFGVWDASGWYEGEYCQDVHRRKGSWGGGGLENIVTGTERDQSGARSAGSCAACHAAHERLEKQEATTYIRTEYQEEASTWNENRRKIYAENPLNLAQK